MGHFLNETAAIVILIDFFSRPGCNVYGVIEGLKLPEILVWFGKCRNKLNRNIVTH